MKNQLDLIISIVSIVLAIIGAIVLFATKPEPIAPPAAPTATLTPVSLPDGKTLVQFQNGLGGATAAAGGGFGGFGGPGGRPGAAGAGPGGGGRARIGGGGAGRAGGG